MSHEKAEQTLDDMIFLSHFYGYMILALAGVSDLKPLFPAPHKQWGPMATVYTGEAEESPSPDGEGQSGQM